MSGFCLLILTIFVLLNIYHMKGFIKITQINNQAVYINIKQIVKMDKTQNGTDILLTTLEKIETKVDFDDIEKLVDSASSF